MLMQAETWQQGTGAAALGSHLDISLAAKKCEEFFFLFLLPVMV